MDDPDSDDELLESLYDLTPEFGIAGPEMVVEEEQYELVGDGGGREHGFGVDSDELEHGVADLPVSGKEKVFQLLVLQLHLHYPVLQLSLTHQVLLPAHPQQTAVQLLPH